MKTLNENQKDIIGTILALSLFWLVMGYFTATQPIHIKTDKVPQIVQEHVQSPVLEKYGELITNNK